MDTRKIHFIREVLRMDLRGKETPTMQFSGDNASYLHPTFLWAPLADEAQMRALYVSLGGERADGVEIGTTVIIPNRPWYFRFSSISADQVRVVASTDSPRHPEETPHSDQARLGLPYSVMGEHED